MGVTRFLLNTTSIPNTMLCSYSSQRLFLLLLLLAGTYLTGSAQVTSNQDSTNAPATTPVTKPEPAAKPMLRMNLSDDGKHFIQVTFLNQLWLRYNDSNPGTSVYETAKPSTFDVSLRRTRIQLFGQLTDRVFFYAQFGQNNFNYLSARKNGTFFHDVIGEYAVVPGHFSLGGGLTAWSGLSRYASPSVGTILGMDAPLYQQATNDATDQFLRKLSVYAKGKLGKLDYRIALTNPLPIQTSTMAPTVVTRNADFSLDAPSNQVQGYFSYQFFDQESNLTPYNTGSYLGQKRVFNVGAGFITQPGAMAHLDAQGQVVNTAMNLLAVDIFYDAPINREKSSAVTLYGSYAHYDFGPGYIRNLGVNNPANGVVAGQGSFNGSGNAFPMIGTGDIFFGQAGYLLPKSKPASCQLQPYASLMMANYDRLASTMVSYDLGLNWLVNGHGSKFSLNYQNRPIFGLADTTTGLAPHTGSKGAVVLQYQIYVQ
jgi:hypothetical protein